MSHVANDYAEIEQHEIWLLKARALQKGTRCKKAAFLLSIERDYVAMIKEEEDDPSEVSAKDNASSDN
jgi:hypothetical protein